jgi:hypothetical protein
MTLKLAQLPLHLTASDAHTLIDFLNQITDLLWNQYGQQIKLHADRYRPIAHRDDPLDDELIDGDFDPRQHHLPFDDPLPF